MNNKNVFEDSIIELCKGLSPEKVKRLDFVLTQEKSETEIIKDIIAEFPNFKIIYTANLSK